MPCGDRDAYRHYNDSALRKRNDLLARVLCRLLGTLEKDNRVDVAGILSADPELSKWWIEHKRQDADRERREAESLRRAELLLQALEKLTDEEIKALNAGWLR